MSSVLVTGGAGSFGQAFVRHLLAGDEHERICVYSRGEHAQAAMREALRDNSRLRWFIGDVRDRDRLRRAMMGCDVVIHAAALKRIEVGAYGPDEVVKTNVIGAMNVIEAAIDAGVQRVVALSTDKAWQPISPYGQTKALAESLFLTANVYRGPTFVVTRYGNVAGSAGSIIPKWKEATAGRRQVLATNLDCTRFWMSMAEAVQLVYDAAFNPLCAEHLERPILPLDLPAYRVGDLAEAMGVELALPTGLPSFEKLHEGLCDGYTSDKARRLSVADLKERLVDL